MISKKNIRDLFKELDKALGEKGERREIIVFGSGPLIANDVVDRATVDIDMVEPPMDMILQLIAAEIGDKFGLDMTWLNSAGHIFSRNLPDGWKDRAKGHFEGKSLRVKFLDRGDLIITKFYAACQRGELDINDLAALNPTPPELTKAESWALKRENDPDWPAQVRLTLNTVKKKLKERDKGLGR